MVKIAGMGDNVVDCYPSKRLMYPGGNCLNVSVFARRFGANSAYIGAVGEDSAGSCIASALQEEGVDISRLRVLKGSTAYCVIGHRGADRVFLASDLGVSRFEPSPDDIAFLRDVDAVHVGQSSHLDDHIGAIAGAAPLSYDFSVRRDAQHREVIAPQCFLASFSAGDLTQDAAGAIVEHLLQLGAEWVLMTRGPEGATLTNPRARFHVAASPSRAIDTLGAGDTFIARTLCGLLLCEQPQDLLVAASLAAARTCEYFGAIGHGARLAIETVAVHDANFI